MLRYFPYYIAHPYFEDLHNANDEPVSKSTFDWAWDNFQPTSEKLQSMIYDESLVYGEKEKEKVGSSGSTVNRYSREKEGKYKN